MGEELSIEHRMMQAETRWGCVLKRKNRNEAAGPCPLCSLADKDGFLVFGDGGYFCRKCGSKGWLDENDAKPLSQAKLLELRVAKLERQQREHEERLTLLEEMARCKDHLAYHAGLTERAREYWWGEGITDESIEHYLLGWCPRCPTYPESPSYTIPVVRRGALQNIRHRLQHPNGKGKYRPHRSGLGNSLYLADLLDEPRKSIIVTEGEKKAIVATQSGFPAVGICGKRSFNREWLEWFDEIQVVYIALDPDATESAFRLGALFGDRARVARLPAKLDDMIVRYGANSDDIDAYLGTARPVKGNGKAN